MNRKKNTKKKQQEKNVQRFFVRPFVKHISFKAKKKKQLKRKISLVIKLKKETRIIALQRGYCRNALI